MKGINFLTLNPMTVESLIQEYVRSQLQLDKNTVVGCVRYNIESNDYTVELVEKTLVEKAKK